MSISSAIDILMLLFQKIGGKYLLQNRRKTQAMLHSRYMSFLYNTLENTAGQCSKSEECATRLNYVREQEHFMPTESWIELQSRRMS